MEDVKNYPHYLDHPKPHKEQINADRIRSLSDEELADFIDRYVEIGNCEKCKWKGRHQKCSCCRRNRYIKDCYETEWNNGG